MILLRSALFNVLFFGTTFVLVWPGTLIRLLRPDAVMGIARLWARLIVGYARAICGIRLEVTGLENLPAGAALIASRHQSAFDTMVWLTLVPRACYVLKHELLRIPLFGPMVLAAGMIAVDRKGGTATMRTLMREGKRAAEEHRQIIIFPEGTRADADAMLPLQPGVAALAARTGLPVIPVVTNSGAVWGRRSFHKLPGTIRIVILPPIGPGLPREDLMARLDTALRQPP